MGLPDNLKTRPKPPSGFSQRGSSGLQTGRWNEVLRPSPNRFRSPGFKVLGFVFLEVHGLQAGLKTSIGLGFRVASTMNENEI